MTQGQDGGLGMTHPTDEELIARAKQVIEGNDKPTVILSRDEAAAMLRACKGRVRVKALEWLDRNNKERPVRFITNSKCGFYQITEWLDGSGHVMCFLTPFARPQRVWDAPTCAGGAGPLKAAAQADYEARILSALEPAPDHAEWNAAIDAAADLFGEQSNTSRAIGNVLRALKKGPIHD